MLSNHLDTPFENKSTDSF